MREAFTLIELLIVLAIIGILMGIGIPIYTNQLTKAKVQAVAANLKILADAITRAIMTGDIKKDSETVLTDQEIKNFVKGIDTRVYKVKVTPSGGVYTVDAYYTKGDVDAEDVANAVVGCDATDTTDGYPHCLMQNIRSIF